MPNQLPDRLTVSLQVMQRFRDSGQSYTPQDIERATEETLHTIREQHFANMPRGQAMYGYEGKEASAGFLKRMVHTASTMGHNLVAGSIGSALSMSDSDWAVRASEDMRKWAHESVAENVARDPELQAYYAWKEDEPSWAGGFDTTMRAMSEVIPSLATSIAGTALGIAMAPSTGGGSLAATVASLAPMFLLENSSHYIEQMNLMVDEMGMSPEEANEYAGVSALAYGVLAATLERVGARTMMKGVPGLDQFVPEKAMMRKITESIVNSGAKKSTIARMGMNNIARLTNVIEKAMVEGGTEWSQAMLEATSLYATEHDFKSGADFLKVLGESAKSEGVLEQAFGGGVMGVPFGLFLPGGSKAISSRQSQKIMDRVREKSKAGGFDEAVEEDTPDYLNNYLSAIVNPTERMGSFLENFEASDDKTSKAIDKVKGDVSYSSAILRLIKEDPTVVAAIENHTDRDRLLRLASQKLNKQNPQERQIDTENTDEMVNAIKMFADKGNITQAKTPSDLAQSPEEPSIEWSGDLIDQTPDENLFYPKLEEEPTVTDQPSTAEEPVGEEISQQAIEELEKRVGGISKPVKPIVETQEDRKVNVGKVAVVADIKRGKVKALSGKQVSILAATAKMYKVQELDDSGQPTGPQMYVYPNELGIYEGEIAPSTSQKVVEGKKKPLDINQRKVSDELTAEDLLGKEEAVEEKTPQQEIDDLKVQAAYLEKTFVVKGKEGQPSYVQAQKQIKEAEARIKELQKQEETVKAQPEVEAEVDHTVPEKSGMRKNPFEFASEIENRPKDVDVRTKYALAWVEYSNQRPDLKTAKEEALKNIKALEDMKVSGFSKAVEAKANAKKLRQMLGQEVQEVSQSEVKADVFSALAPNTVEEDAVLKNLDKDLPPNTPDVNQPVEDLTELEENINDNQLRAEQRKKDYIVDGESYKRVSNVIGTTYTGKGYPDAIKAGNIVDSLVRSFFTEGETPVHNDQEITKESFDSLMKALGAVKEQIDQLGLTVMSNNIITWDDSSGVAGEVDLLVLNPKTGKIQIWDIKTSKTRTTSKAYNRKWKGNELERSKKDQHSIQLSAYKRLIENQYGIEVEKIAIFPFYINYNKAGRITFLEKEKGLKLGFNKAFTDTVIPPNKMSANISSVAPEVVVAPEAVAEPKPTPVVSENKKIQLAKEKAAINAGFNDWYEVNDALGINRTAALFNALSQEQIKKAAEQQELTGRGRIEDLGGLVRKEVPPEPVAQEEPVDPDDLSDADVEKLKNTLFGRMADPQTDQEKGYETDEDVQQEDDDDDQTFFQKEKSSKMPKIVDNPELAKKIVARLRKYFGKYITDETFEGTLEDNGRKVVGVAFRNIAMWSKTDATIDTMPHEYAHIYVSLMRESSLVRRGIKYFGSEEKLVQHIGEYYANRIQNKSVLQRIKIWIRQFANTLKNIFKPMPDEVIGNYLAEEFYQGKWEGGWDAPRKDSQYDAYLKYQPQQPIDEEGIASGVPTHRISAKDIPSDLHQKEFFHKVFGVHIEKAQIPFLTELAKDNESFDDYLVAIKSWAKDQANEKSYRVNIRTDFDAAELNELKIMYLKDRDKIYRYVKGKKEGLFTRIYQTLLLPVGKGTKDVAPNVGIAPLERLDTGSKESQSHATNFVEEDIQRGHHDKKIIFLPMRNILSKWFNKDKNKDVYWQASSKLTENLLDKLEKSYVSKYIRQLVKYGEDKANLLFVLGIKGGDNDAMLIGKASKDFSSFTQEQFKNYLNEEVQAGRMKESQRDVILEEYVMDEETAVEYALETINRKDVMKFVELQEGETLKQAKMRVAKSLIPMIKSIPFAQAASIHEYMKAIKYNKYAMDEKHILDTYTRLSIDLSEGYSPKTNDNSLQSTIMIVPKNTIIRSRDKITGELIEQPGQRLKTFEDTDGQLMTGSQWMKSLGENIGTPNLAAIKTTIRHRSKNGNDYLGMKHLQMVPFDNLEFYKPGSDIPFARVTEYEGETYFEKLDDEGYPLLGQDFDHIGSPNEAKQRSGKFLEDYKTHDINESDVKVILNPAKSSDTAAHPIALGEILLDPNILSNQDKPEALELAKQIIKHYADYDNKGKLVGGVAKEYLDMLKAMRENPKTFLAAVRRTLEEGRIPTEAEKWLEILEKTEGEGINHKYITNLFVSYLNNIYFSNGIYKSRKMGRGNATHGYLKPVLNMGIQEGSVAVSSDNTTVYNKAIKHWAKINDHLRVAAEQRGEKLNEFQLFNRYTRRMDGNEKIDVLNEALSQQELHVLIHRQPIAKVTGVVTRRVQMLVAGGHGDTIFLNESDVTEVLDGDYDGDHGFLEFIEGDLLKAYQNWQNSDTFAEKDKVVAVPMFGEKLEDTTSDVTYLSKESKNSAIVGQASVSGSQGRTTNAKTVMTQLAYKNLKLYIPSLEGGFLSSKKPSDSVVMDYIPLDINQLNKNNGELINIIIRTNKDLIVDENGDPVIPSRTDDGFSIKSKDDIFLQTTVEHELAILLQMSVDNKKFGLLSKIGWDNDFIIRRIFQRSDGDELNSSNIHTLRILFRVQNFSSQRAGRTDSRNVASMNRVVEDSSTLAERFFDPETGKRISKENVGKQYIEEFKALLKKNKFRYKGENPDNISTNGSITPGEILISSVGREYNKLVNEIESAEQAGSHFLDWAETAYQIAHQRSINELGNTPNWFNEDSWSNQELLEAYEYLVVPKHDVIDSEGNPTGKLLSLNDKFWKIYNDAAKANRDDTPIHISADYNVELSKFVEDHIDDWMSLSEDAKQLVTALFLKGVGKRTNVLTLMPLDVMSHAVTEEFIPVFTKHLKSLTDKDFSEQTGKVKAKPGYKKLQALVVKASKLYKEKADQVRINCK
tara:strand:- start:4260 stop:12782 length:8523 start_codon:yes stop_codon:yes gene_type:complete